MSRILIVEDEQHLAIGLQFNLESDGHQVECAETGEVALSRVDAEPALDLVVLDVMLPGVDGFHVAAEMRKRLREELEKRVGTITRHGTLADLIPKASPAARDAQEPPAI